MPCGKGPRKPRAGGHGAASPACRTCHSSGLCRLLHFLLVVPPELREPVHLDVRLPDGMADLPEAGEVVPVRDFAIEHGRLRGGGSEGGERTVSALQDSLEPNPPHETRPSRFLICEPRPALPCPHMPRGRRTRMRNSSRTFHMSPQALPQQPRELLPAEPTLRTWDPVGMDGGPENRTVPMYRCSHMPLRPRDTPHL